MSADRALHLTALHARTGQPATVPEDQLAFDPGKTQRSTEREDLLQSDGATRVIEREYQQASAEYTEALTAGQNGLRGRDPEAFRRLQERVRRLDRERSRQLTRGVKSGVDATRLDEAGWGLVLPYAESEDNAHDLALLQKLSPLIEWRRQQAGRRFVLLHGPNGYREGESKTQFLARLRTATAGAVDPDKLPYYLLLVGSPEQIPFWFQSHLDVQYGVGRLYFDQLDDYGRYAENVVRVEKNGNPRPRRMSAFATLHPWDEATALSCKQLVEPLLRRFGTDYSRVPIDAALRGEATRERLLRWLGGPDAPALLFTATHGLAFDAGDPLQRERQGAIVCSDWPGRRAWGHREIAESQYVSGDLLPADSDASGMILFCVSCYSGGTPRSDSYGHHEAKDADAALATLAPQPFVGGLPRKLLGGLERGALAVIAHIDRLWGLSYLPPGSSRTEPVLAADFQSLLERLVSGAPVGWAMEYFNQRYAELSTLLSEYYDERARGAVRPGVDLLDLWTANNDARDYIVLGDPAVRLPPFFSDGESDSQSLPGELSAHLSSDAWRRTPAETQQLLRALGQVGLADLLAKLPRR